MQTPHSLIRTKLHLPFIRPGIVSRPRLQEQIAQGLTGPLTLITAPAGFGKTTLVASAIYNTGLSVAWLSLDRNDNQEWRFLNYLLAALQAADPSIGCEAAQLLEAAQRATPEAILTSLVNDLGSLTSEMVLVLDDYQLISNPAVHEGVTFLLEHCPQVFHLVIATRSDPPLPLSRLRGRGHLVELRTADLRFTRSEATQFLNEVMGLHLDAGGIENLPLYKIDFDRLSDGKYHGVYAGGMYKWRYSECDVTANGKVTGIQITATNDSGAENTNQQILYERVIQAQSLQVDTISGSTLTSKGWLQCVENALAQAQHE